MATKKASTKTINTPKQANNTKTVSKTKTASKAKTAETKVKTLPQDTYYEILKQHDPRFDGRFFVGVKSTGIYCRSVCKAKLPMKKNCVFFETAAEAEGQGFRPCLLCRPELAPSVSVAMQKENLVRRASQLIRTQEAGTSIAHIAEYLGVSERQLRRSFEDECGITPTQYRNTCRLLLAKSLLTDTQLSITQVAFASGFSSVRRFNDAFASHYKMPPSRFRKNNKKNNAQKLEAPNKTLGNTKASAAAKASTQDSKEQKINEAFYQESIVTYLGYRKPYRFDLLLQFLGFRALLGVESVVNNVYRRTIHYKQDGKEYKGWVEVSNEDEKSRLCVRVSLSLIEVLPAVLGKMRHLFDTDGTPDAVEVGLKDFYKKVAKKHHIEGIRLPGCTDGFETCMRAILGQQITVKAANTLAGRVAAEFGSKAKTPFPELTTYFPFPAKFCKKGVTDTLGELGIIARRAKLICMVASMVENKELVLLPGADTPEVCEKILALPGVGDWTLQYLLMRVFANPDAFPAADYGVKLALEPLSVKEIEKISEAWAPWRAYATMSLWSALH